MCWNDIRNIGKGGTKIDLITKDIKNAVANVLISDVRRAVEIKEYEDEGTGFFLELDDGRVLCVIGQDLYEYAHDAEFEKGATDMRHLFPQTGIEYRFAPLRGWRLSIKGTKEPLQAYGRVATTRRFFKKDKASGQRVYTGPEDGAFYDGPMEVVLNKFGYKLEG